MKTWLHPFRPFSSPPAYCDTTTPGHTSPAPNPGIPGIHPTAPSPSPWPPPSPCRWRPCSLYPHPAPSTPQPHTGETPGRGSTPTSGPAIPRCPASYRPQRIMPLGSHHSGLDRVSDPFRPAWDICPPREAWSPNRCPTPLRGPTLPSGCCAPGRPTGGVVVLRRPRMSRSEGYATGYATAKGWKRDRSRLSATAKLSNRQHPIRIGMCRRAGSPALVIGIDATPPVPVPKPGSGKLGCPLVVGGVAVPTPGTRSGFRKRRLCGSLAPYRAEHDPPKGGYATAAGWIRDRCGWKRDRDRVEARPGSGSPLVCLMATTQFCPSVSDRRPGSGPGQGCRR